MSLSPRDACGAIEKAIRRALASDRRARSMTWMDDRLVVKLADAHERLLHARRIAERQVGAPNRSGKEQIAAEHDVSASKHHVPRRVSGRRASPRTTESRGSARRRPRAQRRAARAARTEHRTSPPAASPGDTAEGPPDACAPGRKLAQHAGDAADVIEMAVGQPDRVERCPDRRSMSSNSSGSAPGSISAARCVASSTRDTNSR